MYVCMYVYMYTGLEIGGFALPNANHFWGKCKSLWPIYSQYFWVIANQYKPIVNHFCFWIRKKTLYVGVLCNKKQQCEQIANHCLSI